MGPACRGLRGDERQELDRLAQAHVVGQDAAQAQVAQEGEPRKPALLVGPQRPGEARGRRHRRQPPVGLPGQQVAEPAVGVHADQRDLVAGAALGQSEAGQQRVGGRHRARLTALQELQRGLEVRLVQLDPLAAQPDQRDLEPGQLGQLGRVDHLVADGHVVAEVHQVAEPEPGLGDRRAGRGGLGPGGQLEPEPGLAHPVRQQHPEPGPGQQRPGFLQEPERARGVQLQHRRLRLAQRVLQLAEQPGGGAQPGQQLLDRVVAAGPDALARPGVAVPDIGGRDHQARVLGRLQRELHPPRIFLGHRGLGQPEAGPHRAGRDERAVQPRVQLRGQLGGLGFVPRRHHVEASIGAGQCDHVPFGQRNLSRSTAAPRGQEGTRQAGARRGVGEAVERGGQQDGRRIPGHGPARGGHGGGQVTRALRVRAAEHRAPAGRVGAVLGDQDRQHPAARRQAVGEASQRGQVRQRGAQVRQLAEAGGRAEQVQRGGRGKGQDRHPPASQPDPAGPGCRRGGRVRRVRTVRRVRRGQRVRRGRPDELGRGERPGRACGRRQLQRELGVDGLAGRLAGRPGQGGQQVGQLAGLAGERMQRRGRRLVTRRGRQVRVFRPEAERAARPDPMYDPHARLPPGESR